MLSEVIDEETFEGGIYAGVQARGVATGAWGRAGETVAREIGVPEQSIRNWVKAQGEGKLGMAENGKPITPEQMEISRLRAEVARLRMEMEIVKKAAYFAKERCEVRVR